MRHADQCYNGTTTFKELAQMIIEFKSPFLVGDILVGYCLGLKHVYRISKVVKVNPKTVVVLTYNDWEKRELWYSSLPRLSYKYKRGFLTRRRLICEDGDVAFLVFDDRQYKKVTLDGENKLIFSARSILPYGNDVALQRNIASMKKFMAYKP